MNRVCVALITVLALLGCASTPSSRAPQQRELSLKPILADYGYTEIPLLRTVSGDFLVRAKINGTEAMLVVDTGATMTILDSSAREVYSLTELYTTSIPAFGLGGQFTVSVSTIESFEVGPLKLSNRPTFLTDFGKLYGIKDPGSEREVHGLLGQDVLGTYEAIIDCRTRLLYLKVK